MTQHSPAVAAALQTLQDDESTPVTRYNAFVTLCLHGDASAEVWHDVLLRHMQQSTDWGVRQNAAWAAGQLRSSGCVHGLAALVVNADEDEQVKYVAALGLVYIGDDTAMTVLHRIAQGTMETDGGGQRAAAAALRAQPYIQG